jgi:hypothetical protein
MINQAVSYAGFRTISPVTYFGLPGTDVTCVVVFAVEELSVHPVKRTQEIRSNTRQDTSRIFLFILLNVPEDYFKKSLYAYI